MLWRSRGHAHQGRRVQLKWLLSRYGTRTLVERPGSALFCGQAADSLKAKQLSYIHHDGRISRCWEGIVTVAVASDEWCQLVTAMRARPCVAVLRSRVVTSSKRTPEGGMVTAAEKPSWVEAHSCHADVAAVVPEHAMTWQTPGVRSPLPRCGSARLTLFCCSCCLSSLQITQERDAAQPPWARPRSPPPRCRAVEAHNLRR